MPSLCHKDQNDFLSRKIFTERKCSESNPDLLPPVVPRQVPGRAQSEVVPGPLEGAGLALDHTVQHNLLALPHRHALRLVQELLLGPDDTEEGQEEGGDDVELHDDDEDGHVMSLLHNVWR